MKLYVFGCLAFAQLALGYGTIPGDRDLGYGSLEPPRCGYVCKSNRSPEGGLCSFIEQALGVSYPVMDYEGPCFLNLFSPDSGPDGFDTDLTRCDAVSGLLLWDEPYTQADRAWQYRSWSDMGYIVDQWKNFATRNHDIIMKKRQAGMKVSAPQFSSHRGGSVDNKLREFFRLCGSPCEDPGSPMKIDVVAFNAYLNTGGSFDGQARWIRDTAGYYRSEFHRDVWVTNYGVLNQRDTRRVTLQDQVVAMTYIPGLTSVDRVYYFSAEDVCGPDWAMQGGVRYHEEGFPCVPLEVNSLTNAAVKDAFLESCNPRTDLGTDPCDALVGTGKQCYLNADGSAQTDPWCLEDEAQCTQCASTWCPPPSTPGTDPGTDPCDALLGTGKQCYLNADGSAQTDPWCLENEAQCTQCASTWCLPPLTPGTDPGAPVTPSTTSDSSRIVVATWNTQWWCMSRGLGQLIDFFKLHGPYDIIGFQEMGNVNQFLRGTGLNGEQFGHEVALAHNPARFQVQDSRSVQVTEDQYGQRIIAWQLLLDKATGHKIIHVNHHGCIGCRPSMSRLYTADPIWNAMAEVMSTQDVQLFTCDCQGSWGNYGEYFDEHLTKAWGTFEKLRGSRGQCGDIDYIYYNPAKIQLVSDPEFFGGRSCGCSQCGCGTWESDHSMVKAVFKYISPSTLSSDDPTPQPTPSNDPCMTSSWPDRDNGLVCDNCKVLVDKFSSKYLTCSGYCSSISRHCVNAWEEKDDTCEELHSMTCDEALSSSDAICECSTTTSEPDETDDPCMTSSWPNLDHGVVCGNCKALVDKFNSKYLTCNGYCSSIGRQCVQAWEEETEARCDVKQSMTCDESYPSSDAICECSTETSTP